MKFREFIYTGEPVPQITETEHLAFYLLFQKALLAALNQRGLLTHFEYDLCLKEAEKHCKIYT